MGKSVEAYAMDEAILFYKRQGWHVENVAHAQGSHGGYDLFVTKGPKQKKVEVKGCTDPCGIPDLYDTQVDRNTLRLVADELCVVYMPTPERTHRIAIIPGELIQPEHLVEKRSYRITRAIKNATTISRYIVE
jgi:hypothetical protein